MFLEISNRSSFVLVCIQIKISILYWRVEWEGGGEVGAKGGLSPTT